MIDCGDHDGCVSQCPEDETGEPCGCSTTSPVTVGEWQENIVSLIVMMLAEEGM